jgi:hypothetical protein
LERRVEVLEANQGNTYLGGRQEKSDVNQ